MTNLSFAKYTKHILPLHTLPCNASGCVTWLQRTLLVLTSFPGKHALRVLYARLHTHLGCIQAFPLPSCLSAMFLIPCCHSQNPQQATGKYNPSYNTLGTIYESYAALQSQYLIHADPICSKKLCFNTVSPPKHTQTSCLSEHR